MAMKLRMSKCVNGGHHFADLCRYDGDKIVQNCCDYLRKIFMRFSEKDQMLIPINKPLKSTRPKLKIIKCRSHSRDVAKIPVGGGGAGA